MPEIVITDKAASVRGVLGYEGHVLYRRVEHEGKIIYSLLYQRAPPHGKLHYQLYGRGI